MKLVVTVAEINRYLVEEEAVLAHGVIRVREGGEVEEVESGEASEEQLVEVLAEGWQDGYDWTFGDTPAEHVLDVRRVEESDPAYREIVGDRVMYEVPDEAVALTHEEARALRAHLKGHAVPDVSAQLESLRVIAEKLDEAIR